MPKPSQLILYLLIHLVERKIYKIYKFIKNINSKLSFYIYMREVLITLRQEIVGTTTDNMEKNVNDFLFFSCYHDIGTKFTHMTKVPLLVVGNIRRSLETSGFQ